MDMGQYEEKKIYRAVSSWIWELKLKIIKWWINEMDSGKLLWALGKGGVEIIDSSVQKAIDRKRPERKKAQLNSNDSLI